ncbi:MAG: hypothetical protein ABI690_20855 [Chloroflexota bacterium]
MPYKSIPFLASTSPKMAFLFKTPQGRPTYHQHIEKPTEGA